MSHFHKYVGFCKSVLTCLSHNVYISFLGYPGDMPIVTCHNRDQAFRIGSHTPAPHGRNYIRIENSDKINVLLDGFNKANITYT